MEISDNEVMSRLSGAILLIAGLVLVIFHKPISEITVDLNVAFGISKRTDSYARSVKIGFVLIALVSIIVGILLLSGRIEIGGNAGLGPP